MIVGQKKKKWVMGIWDDDFYIYSHEEKREIISTLLSYYLYFITDMQRIYSLIN